MGQSLLGQSQPGGAQSQAVAVPEPPPVVAAPAMPAVSSPPPAVPPPPGLTQTPLPPPGMVQQSSMPSDNVGAAPSSSGAESAAQPVEAAPVSAQAVPVPAQAVSPSAQVAASAPNQVGASASSPSTSVGAAPGGTAPSPLPSNDVAPAQDNSWVYGHTAELGVLNKVDGSTETIKVPVGGQATSGDLTVSVQACVMRPPGELPNAAVYLTLQATKAEDSNSPVYQGWIVKSAPGASSSENADEAFRVINCS